METIEIEWSQYFGNNLRIKNEITKKKKIGEKTENHF